VSETSQLIAFVNGLTRSKLSMRTGATALITRNVPAIRRLRDDGRSWDEIAAGLAALGARQKDRPTGLYRPISGKRCAALVSAIEKREARRALRQAKRKRRADLVIPPSSHKLVAIAPTADARSSQVTTEDKLRQEAFARVQSMMKDKS
jgi:hypothetical protein